MAIITGGYAHLPGGGPAMTMCRDCKYIKWRNGSNYCLKAEKMLGGKARPIQSHAASCKYYEKKEPPYVTGQ